MLKSHNEVMVVNTKIKNHNYSYKIEYSGWFRGKKWVIKLTSEEDFLLFCDSFDFFLSRGDFFKLRQMFDAQRDGPCPFPCPCTVLAEGVGFFSLDSPAPILE